MFSIPQWMSSLFCVTFVSLCFHLACWHVDLYYVHPSQYPSPPNYPRTPPPRPSMHTGNQCNDVTKFDDVLFLVGDQAKAQSKQSQNSKLDGSSITVSSELSRPALYVQRAAYACILEGREMTLPHFEGRLSTAARRLFRVTVTHTGGDIGIQAWKVKQKGCLFQPPWLEEGEGGTRKGLSNGTWNREIFPHCLILHSVKWYNKLYYSEIVVKPSPNHCTMGCEK